MGFLSKTSEREQKLKEFKAKTNLNIDPDTHEELINKFGSEETYFKVAYNLFKNNLDITENEYSKIMSEYSKIKTLITDTDEFIEALKVLSEYPKILDTNIFNSIAYAFSNKKEVSEVLFYIFNLFRNSNGEVEIENLENLEEAVSYLTKARRYYVDDRSLIASFITFINVLDINVLKYGNIEEIDNVLNRFIAEDKRSNGDYELSHEELEYLRQVIEELGVKSEQIRTLMSLSEKNINETKAAYEDLKTSVTDYAARQLKEVENRSASALSTFNTKYMELVNSQKSGISEEKDLLIRALEATLGEKKTELVSYLNSVKLSYEQEINRLRKEQRGILESIDKYIENSQAVKNLIQTTKTDQDFLDRLTSFEEIAEKVTKNLQQNQGNVGQTTTVIKPESSIVVPSNKVVVASPQNIDLSAIDSKELYYFDRSTKFNKRFKELMEIKKKLIQEGEVFHECFDDVLTILIYNDVPYLYGPSGTGKTHMVENQLSKVLGLDVITSGYIQFEQDVLGYNNAGDGGYVPSNFYRAYVFGNVIFFDELDNSNPKAVPVLNGFLTGKKRQNYTFPNGATVRRHPNFRIVTAGNTKGEGRTTEYSTRQKMDESVLQRIWAVECGYQSDIENMILKDYKAWFEFSQSFRNAIEAIQLSSNSGVNSYGTFTTRDAADVVEYLEDEAFNYKQLIKYKFIQTKDDDYLGLIYSRMLEDSQNYEHKDTKQLLKEFKRQMDERATKRQ